MATKKNTTEETQTPIDQTDDIATDFATDSVADGATDNVADGATDSVAGVADALSDILDDDKPEEFDPFKALMAERDDLKDQLLRALAEVENMRTRTERDINQAHKYGHAGFARDLLSVVDNLSRALTALPVERTQLDDATSTLITGIEMISKEISTVLERHGIIQINPMGEKFDYDRHQAMFEIETSDSEPGTIVQVAQPGWMLHDRLLSPAMVGVAKKPDNKNSKEEE